jgi:hypothetical protein
MPQRTAKRLSHGEAVPDFDAHLHVALRGVRSALAEISAAVGADTTRPQNFARHLSLDKSLAWHLSKIITEKDAMSAVGHVPGRAGNRIVIKAFEKAGASEESLSNLRGALAEFDRMVEVHCGDRDTLQMMLGGANSESAARDEIHRKRLFQGASAIWGVQARIHLAAHVVAPNADDSESLDFAIVNGLVDFKRLRPSVPWAVSSLRQYSDDGSPLPVGTFEPLDETVAHDAAPLLREFCSQPLPPVRITPGGPNLTRFEIGEGPVGATGTLTCLTGWMWRKIAARYRTEHDQFGEHQVRLNTPAEMLIFDLYIHRGLEFNLPPQLQLYSQLPGGPLHPDGGQDAGLLRLRENIIDLGSGPPDMITPELPRHSAIAELAMRRLGTSPRDYQGYRLQMRYPPIPTMALYRHTLPERRKSRKG